MSTSTKPTKARTNGAFTLFETLVTLAVITLLAVLLIPSLLNWRKQVYQERLNATSRLLNHACIRAGLEGASIPESNRDTLASVVRWYQDNGYIREAKVDTSGFTLADLGGGSFFDCTNTTIGEATGSNGSPSAPGPIAALWWNTRYIQLALPSQPIDAQYLVLEGSPDNVTWIEVKANITDTYTDGPFQPNTTYYYRVAAVNSNGRTTGPTLTATTAPPLSAPDALTIGSGSTATPSPSLPAGLVTYSAPTMPPSPGASGSSGGSDFGGGVWLPIGTGTSASSGSGTGTSGTMATPGAITFTNVTTYSYTLTLPPLPHDLVEENGRLYDFAWGWTLFSSTTGTNWAAAADWRSTLGPPNVNSEFGWIYQQSGAWLDNPAPMSFSANPGTTYYYQLVGRDTADLLVYGNVVSVTTPGDTGTLGLPSAPGTAIATNVKSTSFSLTMPTLPANATTLTLQSSTDEGATWADASTGLAADAVVPESELTPDTTYYFRLVAVNTYGSTAGGLFAVTTATLPSVPGDISVSNITPTSLSLIMPALPANAISLDLQTSPDGVTTWTTTNGGLPGGATVPEVGLQPSTTYFFRAVAVNSSGSTAGNAFAIATDRPTLPSAPGYVTVSHMTLTSFSLTMPDLPADATSLTLQTSPDEGASWTTASTDLAAFAVVPESGMAPATTYTYRAVAVNAYGSTVGNYTLAVTPPELPSAPDTAVVTYLTATSFKLTMPWWLPAKATSLTLQTSTDAGITWITTNPGLAAGATVTRSGLSAGATYTYRVLAVNSAGSTAGNSFAAVAGAPSMPVGLTVITSAPTAFTLRMPGTLPTGATSLALQSSTDEGTTWITTNSGLAASATVNKTGLTAGTTYTYRIVAVNAVGSTAGAALDIVAGASCTPSVVIPSSITSTSFTLTMPSLPTGAISLTLQVFSNGNWITDSTGLAGGAVVPKSGMTHNTTYSYRMVAVNATGSTVGMSRTVTTAP